MESKKINQLATELAPDLSDLTIIGDPTTGISKKITLSQMASLFTGTVEEYANFAAFPLVGVADTIYIALDTNVLYRWNTGTSAYVELSPNIINSLVFSDANGFDGNISLVGSVATLTITTALTTGSVPFIGASGALSQDNANLFFDDTNNRLGINTNAPTTALDVFGSGIIGRINGTSTNNAFLGFASAGTNKWSIGNVQSDHRFRIYNEATTSELVSVLQTGEFGIGIANPTTKFHIDGAASALIANLDANVSVAKSISFRSDNSARINLEVSGTESGSNAGADFFLRRYSDAGALLDTPLFIKRSTGFIGIGTTTPSTFLHILGTNTSARGQLSIQSNNASNAAKATWYYDTTLQGNIGTTGADFFIESIFNLQILAGGSERLRILSTGFMFFGTIPSATNYMKYNFNVGTDQNIGFRSASGIARLEATNDAVAANIPMELTASRFNFTSGNVGINTSSPASLLQVNYAASGSSSATVAKFSVQDTTGYGVTNPAIELVGTNIGLSFTIGKIAGINDATSGGSLAFSTGDSGTVTEKVRITSTGNVGIGTSSPFSKLSIASPAGITSFPTYSTNDQASINWWYWASAAEGYTRYMDIVAKGAPDGTYGGSVIRFLTNQITNASNPVERMRLKQNGDLIIGTTPTANGHNFFMEAGNGAYQTIGHPAGASTGYSYTLYYYNSSPIGSIAQSGTTAVVFNTTSDYRLKEVISPIENSIDTILKLNPINFKWKNTKDEYGHGFLAHELQEIIPLAVTGEKDALNEDGSFKLQQVDHSKLVPYLVKAIQEQQAQIKELQAKIK